MENSQIKKYFDLYDYETILTALKNKYNFVSFCKKSIPKNGSLTFKTDKINVLSDAKIENVILHRNQRITLKTNHGFIQFFN
jgi:hypothetical protein